MTDRDPLQTLWTSQQQEEFSMSLAEIQSRSTRLQSKVRMRNITEYVAAAIVIGVFLWSAATMSLPVARAGAVLIAAAALYVAIALHRKAPAVKWEPDGSETLAEFHRGELLRQRHALSTVWRWYLLPFLPGFLVFNAGISFAPDNPLPLAAKLGQFGFMIGLMAAMFAVIAWLNHKAAKKLDAEIADLDAARK
ncbi:MAG: hypothetical protein R3C13_06350 [Hyphomonas sp.]|uniref:hypothetical protein n=1 Tax=Hyphomonas sp. TaxID=87 RepID=UPI003528C60A